MFFALKKHYGLSDQVLAEGLVVAGGIGLVIADRASWQVQQAVAKRNVVVRRLWLQVLQLLC